MAVTFQVKVVPSAGKVAWIIDKQQRLKLYVKSPAEKNLANREVVKLVAQALGIPQAEVTIIAGATSRTKLVKVDHQGITLDQLLLALGLGLQQSLLK